MEQGILAGVAEQMLSMIQSHGSSMVYFGVFLLGENGALAAFMLAAQEQLTPQTAFLYAVLGSLSADIFWYWTSVKVLKRFFEKKFLQQEASEQKIFLLKMADQHTFVFLTFIKFLVGMRLFLTVYILLKKQISFARYLLINVVGTVLFIGVLFPAGWFLGKGISAAFTLERGITGLFSVIIVATILFNLLSRIFAFFVGKYVKKRKESERGREAD
ncbi:MAG: hypothetical protein Q7S52_00575 [bacterium]|nr:hypothetical protein [bacterium]